MNFYDSKALENWTPIGYDPSPFGFYPLPGPPKEVLQRVEIEEMADVFEEFNFIDGEIQGVSGASSIDSGDEDANAGGAQQTAQEIQILAAKSEQRAKNVSKYHKRYWEDIGKVFVALVQANGASMATPKLHKKGPSGKYYGKTLDLRTTFSKDGYKVKVGSKADKEAEGQPAAAIQQLQIGERTVPEQHPAPEDPAEEDARLARSHTGGDEGPLVDFAAQNPPLGFLGMAPNGSNRARSAPLLRSKGRMYPQPPTRSLINLIFTNKHATPITTSARLQDGRHDSRNKAAAFIDTDPMWEGIHQCASGQYRQHRRWWPNRSGRARRNAEWQRPLTWQQHDRRNKRPQ